MRNVFSQILPQKSFNAQRANAQNNQHFSHNQREVWKSYKNRSNVSYILPSNLGIVWANSASHSLFCSSPAAA
jgi:hypothetical protein